MNRPPRTAMTMIEVLCATALASLLMVAVLGVVAGLARHEKTLLQLEGRPAWHTLLERQFFADLQPATKISFRTDALVLSGPLARDARTGSATWTDREVAYRIVTSPVGRMLVRSTRDPRSTTSSPDAEIAAVGVARLWVSQSSGGVISPAAETPVVTDLKDGPPPDRLSVTLLDEGNLPLWQAEFNLQ